MRLLLPVVYVALFVTAVIWMFFHSGDAFGAVYAVLLTLPWSLQIRHVSDAISPALMDSSVWWHCVLIVCAGLNGIILFFVGKGIDYIWTRARRRKAN